jgi:DNA ligase-associated metallophosphoesterase
MTAAPIHLSGERLMLDPAGLLAWPAQRTLVVADLHLEKGSHFATRGSFVPPYDTRETLERLALALRRWKPARLVMLGDSFHDARGCARLGDAERAALRRMLDGIEAVWVLGNHDPVAPEDLPGEAVEEWRLGPLAFRHIAKPGAAGRSRATSIRRRACRRGRACDAALLPVGWAARAAAVLRGLYGGLDIRDPAVASLFPRGGRAFLLGQGRLFSFPTGPLRAVAARAALPG